MKRLLIASALLCLCSAPLFAGKPWRTSTVDPVAIDEGDELVGLLVTVGSTTATSPYQNINWGEANGQENKFRAIMVVNTSSFNVLCGTFPAFNVNAPGWAILKTSGIYTSSNHATFYMILEGTTASSQTVRGVISKIK